MALACLGVGLCAGGEAQPEEPVKATVCEIAGHPETFDGKMVEVRALVETGVQDLPGGLEDDSCAGELRFYAPDDQQFLKLAKSRAFQKLVKDVKKNPVVEATVTGMFKRFGTSQKPDNRLALESVQNVTVIPQPKIRVQKR